MKPQKKDWLTRNERWKNENPSNMPDGHSLCLDRQSCQDRDQNAAVLQSYERDRVSATEQRKGVNYETRNSSRRGI